ncbi:hypothetical protein HK096_004304 [Nowakowskiella sp. JEL0078]|nr:hypothetical protein HK096_004304 [Nowakowskiella sp. JEL0078]
MGQEKIDLNEEEQLLIIKRLHKVLRPFLLRRLKKDVESELPDKVETIIKVRMSGLQQLLYENSRNKRSFLDGSQRAILQNLVMHFRKICNHPFVCDPVEDHFNLTNVTDTIYRVAGKFEWLDRTLPKLNVTGHRVLMFFQMTSVMNVMSDYLNWKGFRFLRLDGSVKAEDRGAAMKDFNAPGSEYFIFLLSTRAGGLGLNLQTADTVIIFDSDWNPHQDLQAQDRAHRIGQTKEVRIFRLVTLGLKQKSVEEHILERAQYKLDMDKKVIQGGMFNQKSSEKEREELLRTLFGIDDDEKKNHEDSNEDKEDEELNDDELNEILARNDNELAIFKQMDREREIELDSIWKSRGYEKAPPRLMQLDELPESLMRKDETDPLTGRSDVGRSARDRGSVRYRDLKDDEFFDALERGEDPEDVKSQKEARRRTVGGGASSEEDSDVDVPVVTLPRKRGRPAASDKVISSLGGSGKGRGRGRGRGKVSTVQQSLIVDEPRRRKRRIEEERVDVLAAAERLALTTVCNKLIEIVKNDEILFEYEGYPTKRNRALLFRQLPSKKEYPNYYTLITNPISMEEIEARVNNNTYTSIFHLRDDFKLMFANARIFNLEGSVVYDDANALEELVENELKRMCPGGRLEVRKKRLVVESDDDEEVVTGGDHMSGEAEGESGKKRGLVALPFGLGSGAVLPRIKLRKEDEGGVGKKYKDDDEYEDGEISE